MAQPNDLNAGFGPPNGGHHTCRRERAALKLTSSHCPRGHLPQEDGPLKTIWDSGRLRLPEDVKLSTHQIYRWWGARSLQGY